MTKHLLRNVVCGLGLTALVLQGSYKEPTFKDFEKNSYCIRQRVSMTNTTNNKTGNKTSYGTTFIIDADTKTYFVTNRHVISFDLTGKPDHINIDKVEYTLVDNEDDTNTADDIKLRLVAVSNVSDTALLVYDKPLPYQVVRHASKQEIGDKVFSYGFPDALTKVYREGVIGTRPLYIEHFKDSIITDLNVIPGDSGSPVYRVDAYGVELVGYVVGLIETVGVIVPIHNADNLLSQYRESPCRERDNLEKEISIYKYSAEVKK